MYLTDLKNDIGELEGVLSREKEKNLHLTQLLNKCKKELASCKRTIANYRKAATDMKKDFFLSGGTTAGRSSSVHSISSLGLASAKFKSQADEPPAERTDDATSVTSGKACDD